jgi:hypothetical protein
VIASSASLLIRHRGPNCRITRCTYNHGHLAKDRYRFLLGLWFIKTSRTREIKNLRPEHGQGLRSIRARISLLTRVLPPTRVVCPLPYQRRCSGRTGPERPSSSASARNRSAERPLGGVGWRMHRLRRPFRARLCTNRLGLAVDCLRHRHTGHGGVFLWRSTGLIWDKASCSWSVLHEAGRLGSSGCLPVTRKLAPVRNQSCFAGT